MRAFRFLGFIFLLFVHGSNCLGINERRTPKTHKFISNADHSARFDVDYVSPAHADARHTVLFAIKQRNLELIFSTLDDVSNPFSANYGKHWSNAKVQEMTQNAEGYEQVKSFLQQYSEDMAFIRESRHKHYLAVEAKISTWESVFSTKFHTYHVHGTREKEVQTAFCGESLSLPLELQEHVDSVHRVIDLPVPIYSGVMKHNSIQGAPSMSVEELYNMLHRESTQHLRVKADDDDLSNSYLQDKAYPDKLNTFYDIFRNNVSTKNTQAIFSTIGQTLSISDLNKFQRLFDLTEENIAQNIGGFVESGACSNVDDCIEANLDMQYIMAVAQNMSNTFYYWDGTNDPWLSWLLEVGDMSDPPSIFSISYASYDAAFNGNYIRAFDTEAAKLGLQGVTLVAASGDDGVAGWSARGRADRCGYSLMFPAVSAYVTAVGGTQGPEQGQTEVACQSNRNKGVLITVGGGLSTRRNTPSWQDGLMANYYEQVSTQPAGISTSSGRGIPDISLMAHNYVIVVDDVVYEVDGTSASCPVFAGMLSVINEKRLELGMSTLGWINPALYAQASHFVRDVTTGHNRCTALYNAQGASTCCTEGFYAATGWVSA
ncbi:hypothetical protein EON65_04265 [archaeon]|nr:MAG: hypothetical protein EON65_04265 [archaeon]